MKGKTMELISSVRNPRVLTWKSLADRKGREKADSFLVEGARMVQEALSSDFTVLAVLLREDFIPSFSIPDTVPVYTLSGHVFSAVSDTRTPQGIAAVLSRRLHPAKGTKLVALDAVQDPGNVGTIIRTADAAGFDGVILSSECADVFSPKVLRSTMGSIFRMGFSFPPSLPEALRHCREEGFSVISSQLDGDPFYERTDVSPSFVLVVGNEGSGISEAVRAESTHHLKLPMRGGAESLNAAVAAGIMMYDLTR